METVELSRRPPFKIDNTKQLATQIDHWPHESSQSTCQQAGRVERSAIQHRLIRYTYLIIHPHRRMGSVNFNKMNKIYVSIIGKVRCVGFRYAPHNPPDKK